MKIIVASNVPLDCEKAHAINVMKIAGGFLQLGNDVTIVCRSPIDKSFKKKDFIKKFNLEKSIKIKVFPMIRTLFFLDDQYVFAFQSLFHIFFLKADLIYARQFVLPLLTSLIKINTVVESHTFIERKLFVHKLLVFASKKLKHFRTLITISDILKQNFISKGVPSHKIKIFSSCVDLKLFQKNINYKKKINRKFTILYSGHFYNYKGLGTILDAARLLPNFNFKLLGGAQKDINNLKKTISKYKLTNVNLLGFVDFYKVPNFLFRADVLLLPPSNNHPSSKWTSPVKLGEYLASQTPIICSNIPALKSFLNEEEVTFFEADNPMDLVEKIIWVKENQSEAKAKSINGLKKAMKMSYTIKAKEIIKLIN